MSKKSFASKIKELAVNTQNYKDFQAMKAIVVANPKRYRIVYRGFPWTRNGNAIIEKLPELQELVTRIHSGPVFKSIGFLSLQVLENYKVEVDKLRKKVR